MEELVDLLEFQGLQADNRHKEVLMSLNEILKKIPEEKSSDEMAQIQTILAKIQENQEELPNTIKAMAKAILIRMKEHSDQLVAALAAPKEPVKTVPNNWVATVTQRDNDGGIKTVNINAKA